MNYNTGSVLFPKEELLDFMARNTWILPLDKKGEIMKEFHTNRRPSDGRTACMKKKSEELCFYS